MAENSQPSSTRYMLSGEVDELREAIRKIQVRILSYGDAPSLESFMFMMGFLYGKEAERVHPEQEFREQMNEAVEMRDALMAMHRHDEI